MAKSTSGNVRLQKFLADAGVAARRAAEDLILEGRVVVNGHHIDSLPAFVDPEHDDVRVDGHRVRAVPKVYYVLNKSKGLTGGTAVTGKKRAVDVVADAEARVIPVGRLDDDTDGVMLLTNDGELAQKLTHPRYGVEKVFRAEIRGQIKPEDLAKIRKGVWFSDGRTPEAWVEVTYASREMSILEMTMRESLNRQIPRLFARFGYKLKKLTCIRIGKITTKGMRTKEYRLLKPDEVKHLQKLVEKAEAESLQNPVEEARRPRRPAVKRPGRQAERSTERPDKPSRPGERTPERSGRPSRPGERSPDRPGRPGRSAKATDSPASSRKAPQRPARAKPATGGSARPPRRRGSSSN